jgi:hypothetical protein
LATVHELAIFVFCMIGCGATCWELGRREGIQGTVIYLAERGILTVEEVDD